jgi:hypothetical protein
MRLRCQSAVQLVQFQIERDGRTDMLPGTLQRGRARGLPLAAVGLEATGLAPG